MGTVSASKIEESLNKAKNVGYVEEPFQIGDISVVMRNLRPEAYKAIYEENEEAEGADHVFRFQRSHISRSICEINGTDLRGVDFVEVDEPVIDPKTKAPQLDTAGNPVLKTVKVELHEYLLKYVLQGWSKEATLVTWRKFCDVLNLAEEKAKAGIKFVLPEETPEETFRRVIVQLREAMGGVPEALVESILEEAGLMRISTAEEIKKAMEAADKLSREGAEQQPEGVQEAPQEAPPQPQTPFTGAPPTGPRVRQASVQEIMASRQPLNQEAVTVTHIPPQPQPQPPPPQGYAQDPYVQQPQGQYPPQQPYPPQQQPVYAHPPQQPYPPHPGYSQPPQYAPPPQAYQQNPYAPPQGPPQPPPQVDAQSQLRAAQRSQKIARAEADTINMDPPLPPPGDPSMQMRHVPAGSPHITPGHAPAGTTVQPNAPHLRTGKPPEVPVLHQPGKERVNINEFNKIVEQPPRGGINPRFRPAR